MDINTSAINELTVRLDAIYAALARGADVAPAERFRCEGFAAGLVAAGILSEAEFLERLASTYRQYFHAELPPDAGLDCSIPVSMKRAPVYPSTPQDA